MVRFKPIKGCSLVIGGPLVRTTEVWSVGLVTEHKDFEALREGEGNGKCELGEYIHGKSRLCILKK